METHEIFGSKWKWQEVGGQKILQIERSKLPELASSVECVIGISYGGFLKWGYTQIIQY